MRGCRDNIPDGIAGMGEILPRQRRPRWGSSEHSSPSRWARDRWAGSIRRCRPRRCRTSRRSVHRARGGPENRHASPESYRPILFQVRWSIGRFRTMLAKQPCPHASNDLRPDAVSCRQQIGDTRPGSTHSKPSPSTGDAMSARIRHCLQCPKCLTRYLVSATPYSNGSYLASVALHSFDEYVLYCSCQTPAVVSRWRGDDLHRCEVSRDAHRRGYGSPDEISAMNEDRPAAWAIEIDKYLSPHFTQKARSPRDY